MIAALKKILDAGRTHRVVISILILVSVMLAARAAISDLEMRRAEKKARDAIEYAAETETKAAIIEAAAFEHKARLDSLEIELEQQKRRNTENEKALENAAGNSRIRRDALSRVRNTRTADLDEQQLCRVLAELGHECR